MDDEQQSIRIGKISSINYSAGTARITYEDKDGSTTAEIAFLSHEYFMPRIGDQIIVGLQSNDSSSGVILGTLWNNGHRPPEGRAGIYRKEYCNVDNVAYEKYDANPGVEKFTQDVNNHIHIKAKKTWTLEIKDCPNCKVEIDEEGQMTITMPKGVLIKTPDFKVEDL